MAVLASGMDVNIENGNNQTPLMAAAAGNHVTTMKVLFEHPSIDLNLADRLGSTALIHATFMGNLEAVKPTRLDTPRGVGGYVRILVRRSHMIRKILFYDEC